MARRSDDRRSEAWRTRMGRYEAAGVTVARFCQREGVSVAAFYYWRRRLAQVVSGPGGGLDGQTTQVSGDRSSQPAFQRVTLVRSLSEDETFADGRANDDDPPSSGDSIAISIHLPSGAKIEIAHASLDLIRSLVASQDELGGQTC